jgi:GntR family transcriptional repressor for pyruvate dehydrogenase complex
MSEANNMMVNAKTKTDLVVESVINSIANGKYSSGDKLPAETDYVQNFGVSRVTVREAFKKLSSMGVVSIRQGDGTFVNEVKPFQIVDALLPLLTMNRKAIDDLYETRILIEQAILELVILRKTPGNMEKLQSIISNMETAKDSRNLTEYSIADSVFHDTLTTFCGNSMLESIYDSLSSIRRNNINTSNASMESVEKSLTEHREIVQAILSGDVDKAKSLMKDHLLYSKQNVYRLYPQV